MKSKIKIIPIFLSVFMFVTSIYNCSIVSYATESGGHRPGEDSSDRPGKGDDDSMTFWEKFDALFQDIGTGIMYLCSQLNAFTNRDFSTYVQNLDDWEDYWNEDNIIIDNENETISFSEDLVSYIKQALKEYAEETNGYAILPTTDYRTLSPSQFGSSYQYRTMTNFVREYGLVGVYYRKPNLQLTTYPEYMDGDAAFFKTYTTQNFDSYSFITLTLADLKTWTYNLSGKYLKMNTDFKKELSDWDDVKKNQNPTEGLTYDESKQRGYSMILASGLTINTNSLEATYLISDDGRHVLVFKNLLALENYSVEHRTVYFGSGFYDETGEIKVSYGELEDYLDGKYDDFLDDLRDIIGDSNLTEEEIEKIVDKLIGKIGEIGDSVDDVKDNLKETNSWLEKIYAVLTDIDNTVAGALSGLGFSFDTSTIEAYLDAILAQLGYISDQIDGMTAEEIDEKSDSLLDSLKSLFTDVGEVAKTKFPFSIPWDIHSLLTFLSGGGGSSGASAQLSSYGYTVYSSGFLLEVYGRPGEGSDGKPDSGGHTPGHTVGGHRYGEMGAYRPGSFYLTDKGAPAFKIPLVIKSIGIEEEVVISMDNFGVLSYLSRAIFAAIFAYALINMTIKVLGVGKELSL